MRYLVLALCAMLAFSPASAQQVTTASSGVSGTAGGDLTGTYPSPTIASISGVAVGTPTGTGNVVFSGSPTLSGTVAGTYTLGGTPTITGLASLNGVAVGGVTGTGNIAFGTSPTLATPAISSPALSGTSTGTYTLGGTPTITGLASLNGVAVGGTTGTGNIVFSTSPTFFGTLSAAVIAATGGISATSFTANSTTVPATGINRPAVNQLGFYTASTQAGLFDATQNLILNAQIRVPNMTASSAAQTGTVCWTTGTGAFTVDTTAACLASSARFKMDDRPLDIGLDAVMKMRPVSYELRPEYNLTHLGRQVGLLAEEVGEIDDRLIAHGQDGQTLGVRYMQMTAVLIRAIQDQQREIDDLRKALGR